MQSAVQLWQAVAVFLFENHAEDYSHCKVTGLFLDASRLSRVLAAVTISLGVEGWQIQGRIADSAGFGKYSGIRPRLLFRWKLSDRDVGAAILAL